MRRIKKLFIVIISVVFLTVGTSNISFASLGCSASGSSFLTIFLRSLKTLYNIFPIEIAGVPIEIKSGLETADSLGGSPICMCVLGSPPIPRIGITFSWWNPQAVLETTKAPLCFPTLGFSLGSLGGKYLGEGKFGTSTESGKGNGSNVRNNVGVYENFHYIKYPLFFLLNLLTNTLCLEEVSGIDLFYLSEVDPTWKDDTLSSIINPESILFANPIAQVACIPDSVSSTAGFPIDPLFWCMGSWGSSYPLAGNKAGVAKEASAGVAARGVYRMSRMFMLWQTIGRSTLCQPIPMPIWIKSEYSIFEAYPHLWSLRMPIGRTGLIWTPFANPPNPKKDDNYHPLN